MLRRYYRLFGGWPALVFPLLHHWGVLPLGGAVFACLAYTLLHLVAARPQGLSRRLDIGLAFLWSCAALGVVLLPDSFDRLFNKYIFFSLYSTLFLVVAAPLWLDLTLHGAEAPLSRYQLLDLSRPLTVLWAGLLLASAGLSLQPGWVFKVLIPLALLAAGWPVSGIMIARSRSRAEQERRESGIMVTRDEEPELIPGRLKKPRLGPLREALIIQGDPGGENSLTEEMLVHFTAGLTHEKVPFHMVRLNQMEIKPCLGCRDCWVKKPGVCVHKDDMAGLLEDLVQADLVVLAGPLWFGSLSGLLKIFVDRCLPLLEPWLVAHPERGTHHPAREGNIMGQRLALLAPGSLSREDNFSALKETARQLSLICQSPLAGILIRPAAEVLLLGKRIGPAGELFAEALFRAGVELARSGRVSPETEQAVSAPLYRDEVAFRLQVNLYWETCQEYHAASRAGLELPDFQEFVDNDIRLNMGTMALVFNPEKATEQEITYQFRFSGRQPGEWYLTIKDDRCRFQEGRAKEPDLIVSAASQVWVSVVKGETNLPQAVREGSVRLEGRTELFSSMISSFGWPHTGA